MYNIFMKLKCANCHQRTITLKQTFLSPKNFTCSNCNAELSRENNKYLYYSLLLLGLVLGLLIVKLFIRIGINRYIAIPLFPLMPIICLHVSSYTKLYSNIPKAKTSLKEFILTMIILIPIIMFISTVLGF